jgi:hypothetical protein
VNAYVFHDQSRDPRVVSSIPCDKHPAGLQSRRGDDQVGVTAVRFPLVTRKTATESAEWWID